MTDTSANEGIGYGRPPKITQFQKGKSGNPRGRPRKRKRALPYDAVLGRMVTVREEGRQRRITAAEAFILHLTKKGLEGCGASARASLASIEQARGASRQRQEERRPTKMVIRWFSINCIVEELGMGITLNETDQRKVRFMLQPWIVQAAIHRMKPGTLSISEQQTVLASTRTPQKVDWPVWWEAKP